MRMGAAALQKVGLERRDAAMIAVLLGDQSAASGAAGLNQVHSLLAAGRLSEATAAATPARRPAQRASRPSRRWRPRERLAPLLAEARRAVQKLDEGRAAPAARGRRAISPDDAEAARRGAAGPAAGLRAVFEGDTGPAVLAACARA